MFYKYCTPKCGCFLRRESRKDGRRERRGGRGWGRREQKDRGGRVKEVDGMRDRPVEVGV